MIIEWILRLSCYYFIFNCLISSRMAVLVRKITQFMLGHVNVIWILSLRKEVTKLLLANVFRSIIYMMFVANRPITTGVVFITYAYASGALSVSKLVSAMLLLDIVGTVTGGYVSVAVQNIVETMVSLKRMKVCLYGVFINSLFTLSFSDTAFQNLCFI